MKLVAGLGNPGRQYEGSRHNVGFMVLDLLSRRWDVDLSRHHSRFEGVLGEGGFAGERVLLLKPMTFMNLSGRSVNSVARFYKLTFADVLTVYDDLDLELGDVRVRARGSAGGHRGMSDIIRLAGGDQFPRVRVGIGKSARAATVSHVLGQFAPFEREAIDHALEVAADAVECWVREGVDTAMNRINRRAGGGQRGSKQSDNEGERS